MSRQLLSRLCCIFIHFLQLLVFNFLWSPSYHVKCILVNIVHSKFYITKMKANVLKWSTVRRVHSLHSVECLKERIKTLDYWVASSIGNTRCFFCPFCPVSVNMCSHYSCSYLTALELEVICCCSLPASVFSMLWFLFYIVIQSCDLSYSSFNVSLNQSGHSLLTSPLTFPPPKLLFAVIFLFFKPFCINSGDLYTNIPVSAIL